MIDARWVPPSRRLAGQRRRVVSCRTGTGRPSRVEHDVADRSAAAVTDDGDPGEAGHPGAFSIAALCGTAGRGACARDWARLPTTSATSSATAARTTPGQR